MWFVSFKIKRKVDVCFSNRYQDTDQNQADLTFTHLRVRDKRHTGISYERHTGLQATALSTQLYQPQISMQYWLLYLPRRCLQQRLLVRASKHLHYNQESGYVFWLDLIHSPTRGGTRPIPRKQPNPTVCCCSTGNQSKNCSPKHAYLNVNSKSIALPSEKILLV